MSWIRIDIDLDDIYYEMSLSDKREMANWLFDDGIIGSHTNKEIRKLVIGEGLNFDEELFINNLIKLSNVFYNLSDEDISIINNISKNY